MEGHATITSGGERNYHLGAPYDLAVKITNASRAMSAVKRSYQPVVIIAPIFNSSS
jgi:hypothetical protein